MRYYNINIDQLLEDVYDIYHDARNVLVRFARVGFANVGIASQSVIYIKYTVEDDTVLIDKWELRNGELECVAVRVA